MFLNKYWKINQYYKDMWTLDTKEEEEENDKNNEAYFLILIPSEEKIDFQGLSYKTKNMIDQSIIFKDRIEKDVKTYLEEIVFKFKNKRKKRK